MPATVQLFFEIGTILALASVLAYVARKFRQPEVLAYILTGILVGPFALGLVESSELINIFSDFGIAFLLFTVGLELSLREIKEVGRIAAMVGLAQIIVAASLGFIIMQLLGFTPMQSLYAGIALSFSSTIIVVKLLSEKRELHSLYGRVALGVLIAQDIVAIFVLIFMAGMAGHLPISQLVVWTVVKGILLFACAYVFTKYALHPIFDRIAHWHELLFIASLSYCFVFAYVTYAAGLSLEIGALLAGVSLATLRYNVDIISKAHSLRDFFLVLFFVVLGMKMAISSTAVLVPALVLSLFVLIGNPLVVMLIMGIEGYSRRTSLLTGLSLSQISEFSLILIALGVGLGHLTPDVGSLITFVAIITITASVYFIQFNDQIYNRIGKWLRIFERKDLVESKFIMPKEMRNHAIIFGYHRMGHLIGEHLRKLNIPVLVVDFDPDVINELMAQNRECIYGDMGDPELLERTGLKHAKAAISTVPEQRDNEVLIHKAKELGSKAALVIAADDAGEALDLYKAGADYVIVPHFLGGERAGELVEQFLKDPRSKRGVKADHIKQLIVRQLRGHDKNVKV